MRPATYTSEDLLAIFYGNRTLTKEQLAKNWKGSTMTLWRILSTHGYLTSYNDNGRHYTLRDIPRFDELGLWSYQDARFSRYGTLRDTIAAILENDPTGKDSGELQAVLGVDVRPTLSRLWRDNRVSRERIGNRFVYLAQDPERRQLQIEARRKRVEETLLPEPEKVIAVLVELLRNRQSPPCRLAPRLCRKGVRISVEQVRIIFRHYDLGSKKNWTC